MFTRNDSHGKTIIFLGESIIRKLDRLKEAAII